MKNLALIATLMFAFAAIPQQSFAMSKKSAKAACMKENPEMKGKDLKACIKDKRK
jgi:hypothetical protein